MKRIISIIVAALLLLSLSVSFFGCEDEAVENSSQSAESSVESSAADESVDASVDASSEAEESSKTDEGSEESSADEESSDASDEADESSDEDASSQPDESSKPEENPVETNVALKKTYTRSPLHPGDGNPSYPDEGNKTATDGVIPLDDAKYSSHEFMGFNANTDYYRQNGYALVTVDLGDVYSLNKFVAYLGSKKLGSGIGAPEFVRIYVSNDGKEWYKAGVTSHKDTDAVSYVASTLELDEALTARYVQYRIVAGLYNWMFLGEVEAYGEKADSAKPYPSEKDTKSILFVGNSSTYYFNVPDKLMLLAESVGVELEVTYCCIGGAYLSQYADANDVERGKLLRSKLNEKKYDIIVVQDNSNSDYNDTKSAMDILMPLFKQTQAEAEVMLYERYSSNTDPNQRPISGKRLHEAYTQVAKDFGIEKHAHVADAFLLCYNQNPGIELHFTDNSHHSDVGAYLIASVMAIEFLGIDLDDVTYTGGNDEKTVKALKDVAKLACEKGYEFK